MSPALEARGISKEFDGVRVLNGVNFDVRPGEVHALIGENGAGKSTLMRILAGVYQPTEGQIFLNGEPVVYRDVADAEQRGVIMVHQEFNLVEELTVEQNIFLGREKRRGFWLDKKEMVKEAARILEELECSVHPRTPVRQLSVSQKQMVEIAKAVSRNAKVLIMDEPTSALTPHEVETLFGLIRKLTANGVAVIYISHKLDEVKALADRVTVLRDGNLVATQEAARLTPAQMAALMVGRELKDMFQAKQPPPPTAEVVLEVENLSVPGWVHGCSFSLRRGEILGFAGLIGAGRTELFEAVMGLRRRSSGVIKRRGVPVRVRSLDDAIRHGMVYLPEDRKEKALLVSMTMAPNLTLMSLKEYCKPLIRKGLEREALDRAIAAYDIRAPHREVRVGSLSGGNQQKLALAKFMQVNPEVIVFDEPTRGIDVGTKQQIYRYIWQLAAEGRSCVVISSELPEIIGLCHRVVVMRQGEITGILEGDAVNEEEIMLHATGVKRSL